MKARFLILGNSLSCVCIFSKICKKKKRKKFHFHIFEILGEIHPKLLNQLGCHINFRHMIYTL